MKYTKTKGNTQSSRLWFVDNLRVLLTILVIAHHAGQPYGPTGGMWLIFNPERADILGVFFATNAAFFMGLFFLISGYFVPSAYERKGAKLFLQDRFLRLGIPIVFFALLVFPPVFYFAQSSELSFIQFFFRVYLGQGQIQVGHLWFLVHLLFYGICYVLWRKITKKTITLKPEQQKIAVPKHSLILTYLVALAIVTFITRIQYPVDTWKSLLWIIPAEIAHLPQYLSLFVIGIIAYYHDWFRRMPTQRGLIWLGISLGAVLLRYGYALTANHLFLNRLIAGGSWNWRYAGLLLSSTWEATICVGLCIGLLVLFREQVNRQGKCWQILSANAYTVYIIHILVIIPIQFLFAPLSIAPLLKFLVITFVGIPLCFLISHYIRKLPFARVVL
ncbi:acyltransferase family protein [Mastigocoleus sp. MO_188.B34]|uniref:acyltransferase family protein n=1 Tax=Mastigocoleus sp. MO_188.B34 TaxID=3036635 RepID=UPI0026180408|nr:acyltransferase family protein [Mastigocoleus sp. MO_188.B34]MDJ0696704.1 acyltransferase family protein [Mastigocoleus sp. MO_188.B34]